MTLFVHRSLLTLSGRSAAGEDEQDNGMEMENDFEGEMFDMPDGEDKDQHDKVGDETSLSLQRLRRWIASRFTGVWCVQ